MKLRHLLGKALAIVRLEKPVRDIYYRIFGRWIRRDATVAGQTCRFYCLSQVMAEHVHNMDGETEIMEAFMGQLQPGDTVWDIGANIGTWSLFSARKVGSSGRVIAFDPLPEADVVIQNAKLNELNNVTLLPYALGDQSGETLFYKGTDEVTAVSGLTPPSEHGDAREGIVTTIKRADELFRDQPDLKPTAIKIDVEGAEYKVCSGFDNALWEGIHCAMVEVHPAFMANHGDKVSDLKSLFTQRGFKLDTEMTRRGQSHWLWVKQPN